jgi:hypothetical protein
MPAGATYEPIATTTLGTAATTISFTSIPSTYTDLRVVYVIRSTSTPDFPKIYFNNDTATNYSNTRCFGNGSAASSTTQTSVAGITYMSIPTSTATNEFNLVTLDVFSYAGSTNKTSISRASADKNGSGVTDAGVSLWRSTAAINRVDIVGTFNFAIGTTATLYGIKAA